MKPGAGLLITNARVWTDGRVDERADAIAVAGGRVLAVGRAGELEPLLRSGTGRLDAGGATVTPGIVDSHLHLLAWARSLDEVALAGAASRHEALERVAAFLAAEPEAGPVSGRGWDANAWSEPPERSSLDAVSGQRPVLLHSRDCHAVWVNSAALREAGVTRDTPDPAGGRIERDAAGEPTGIVREHAVRLFAGLEARAVRGSDLERLGRAAARLHAHGVTMVHDFEGVEALRLLRALTRGPERPRLRVVAHLPHAGLEAALAMGLESGVGDDRFRYGAVKLFADGTLGSRTAALLEPYEGGTETGMDLVPPVELARAVAQAAAGGFSVAIHAIGDRAVRSALDAIESSAGALARLALPPRIEHVQLLDPADRPRFAGLGVLASLQPSHCVSDIELAGRGWGARVNRSYPWRSLIEAGASVVFGSDAPVEPPIPALGLHAALTRQRVDGSPAGGFTPGECIGLDQALRAYTGAGAALAGRSAGLGRITPGCAADLVVWDADLHRLPASMLHNARPACTLLAGEAVYVGPPARQQEAFSLRQGLMTDQQPKTIDYRTRPDDELVRFAQGGENRAFDELVRRYQDKVYRLCYKILRHEDDAAEALQDAFLSAYRGLKNFKAESTFSTWLYRVATNASLMKYRKRRDKHISLDQSQNQDDETEPMQLPDWSAQPPEELLTAEMREVMAESIQRLPKELHEVFVRRDIEGLSNAEVGELLGLSVAAVKSRLHRARIALRERLNRYFADKLTRKDRAR